jgi:hypothetical protein
MRVGDRQPQLAPPGMPDGLLQHWNEGRCNRNDTFANFKSWRMAQDGGKQS